MEIDLPEVVREVTAVFERYETAFVTNDIAVLDELFWNDTRTVRYGVGENLYGFAEIQAYRATVPAHNLARQFERTQITTFGRNFATVSTLFMRATSPGQIGRQMQTWVKTDAGWRVTAAHVSVIDAPAQPR